MAEILPASDAQVAEIRKSIAKSLAFTEPGPEGWEGCDTHGGSILLARLDGAEAILRRLAESKVDTDVARDAREWFRARK